jgi:hypothetical protein
MIWSPKRAPFTLPLGLVGGCKCEAPYGTRRRSRKPGSSNGMLRIMAMEPWKLSMRRRMRIGSEFHCRRRTIMTTTRSRMKMCIEFIRLSHAECLQHVQYRCKVPYRLAYLMGGNNNDARIRFLPGNKDWKSNAGLNSIQLLLSWNPSRDANNNLSTVKRSLYILVPDWPIGVDCVAP